MNQTTLSQKILGFLFRKKSVHPQQSRVGISVIKLV